MEKEEKKKKVVINGQEIEVPEGYEVVVEGERIRVVPKEDKETVKVVHAGEDVPEATVRTLRSVGLSFDEEMMRRNIATINKVEYVAEAVIAVFLGVLFTVVGAGISVVGILIPGLFFFLGGLFALWKGILLLTPILKGKTPPKKTPSKKVIS